MRASLLIASFSLLLTLPDFADPTVPELMGQAQKAYIARDYETASELFNEVLQTDPHNTLAIQYLRNIHIAQAGMPKVAKDPIKELVIPQIDFKDATFSSALDFFKAAAAKQGVTVSFVPNLPEPQLEYKVTLNLSQIPFLDALRYLCELDHAVFKQEPFAIVITPAPIDAPPAPAAQ
jgi:hypothetical protein